MKDPQDVLILGGGLAGLTLALQLKKEASNLTVTVLEARSTTAPTAGHKVGESTVELGTYYLRETLGLGAYLDQHHLPKIGLRFFFSPHIKEQLAQRVELGASTLLPVPSHQIDRGIFENDLIEQLKTLGVKVELGAKVKGITIGNPPTTPHTVIFQQEGEEKQIHSNWMVDASGRASLLKRKLGLKKPMNHNNNAVWFRVKGQIDIDNWSENKAWKHKFEPGLRRLSTVHLMGKGYWVWLIPLVSDYTSIGIVTDPRFHDLQTHNTWSKALTWLEEQEICCANALKGKEPIAGDFKQLKNYSRHCEQIYSTQQWGIVGEAGAFLDPFYSPGTDFIALGNTWMSDLIVRQQAGEDVAGRSILYDRVYRAFFESWIPIYNQQYALFGHSQIMVVKILWDWTLYWGFPCLLFTNHAFTNTNLLRALFVKRGAVSQQIKKLNECMQQFFADWASCEQEPTPHINQFIDFMNIPFMKRIHLGLEQQQEEESLLQQCQDNLCILEQMAVHIYKTVHSQQDNLYHLDKINPYKFGLLLSLETLEEQAQTSQALAEDYSIAKDMEAFWLTEKTTV